MKQHFSIAVIVCADALKSGSDTRAKNNFAFSYNTAVETHSERLLSLTGKDCLVGSYRPHTRLDRGRVPRLTSDNFTCCHTRDRAGRP